MLRNGFLGQIATPPCGSLLDEALLRMDGSDWDGAYRLLVEALEQPAMQRDAHLLLSEVCQARGDREAALQHLSDALAQHPLTSRSARPEAGGLVRRRVLMLAVPGDFQANLPLAMLLDDPQTELHTLWITDPAMILSDPWRARALVPRGIDIVFTVIAQDERHTEALRAADMLIATLGLPSLNNPRVISGLSRVDAAWMLEGCDDLIVPQPRLLSRKLLACETIGRGGAEMLVRPQYSHAGLGLARIADAAARDTYLAAHAEETGFILTPFVDTRSADGLFRKYRVVFVGGQWLPVHMAIHSDWAVWYYNAGMQAHRERRREEQAFLAAPREVLSASAQRALDHIGRRIRLDYFGVDFGIAPDGRAVLFEVETGMIVHHSDDPTIFGYRLEAARHIRRETELMIDRRIERRGTVERRAFSRPASDPKMYTVTRRRPPQRLAASGDPLVGAHLPGG